MGFQVGNNACTEKQGDHSQVREARGEGFMPSMLRGHPQHGPEDLHIGEQNESKTAKTKNTTSHKKPNFPNKTQF